MNLAVRNMLLMELPRGGPMPRTNPTISVTIRPDQKAWLKDHPAVNVSGLLQQAIDEIMKARQKP